MGTGAAEIDLGKLRACLRTLRDEEVFLMLDDAIELLELIDDCGHEVLFFADEGGSWLVGVDWGQVLPVWIRALSASTDAKGFAIAVVDRHRRLPPDARADFLGLAESLATPVQAAALAEWIAAETRDSRGDR
jgi:hypothetical protein